MLKPITSLACRFALSATLAVALLVSGLVVMDGAAPPPPARAGDRPDVRLAAVVAGFERLGGIEPRADGQPRQLTDRGRRLLRMMLDH